MSTMESNCGRILALLMTLLGFLTTHATGQETPSFLENGVTAHRGNSIAYPENTMSAFRNAMAAGVDWIEADVWLTKDRELVVIHDSTTARVGNKNLSVISSTYSELRTVDVATEHRQRNQLTLEDCPTQHIPTLADLICEVQKQGQTRLSIQPKMDCVAEVVGLVKKMKAQRWIGFNDGNLEYMSQVKQLAPEIPVFWDRPADTHLEADLQIARKQGFESLVLNRAGVTKDKVRQIQEAGLGAGAWTVNALREMSRLLDFGVQRLYSDDPMSLLGMICERELTDIQCEGRYPHHLQGMDVDEASIYWSFTTKLVKTDRDGNLIKKVDVANHHGDLCLVGGKIYVAVNFGQFNNAEGKADSWVYVYDAESLREEARHEVQEVFYGAGGIGYQEGHFFVVGGLPKEIEENYVYEYDQEFKFLKRHVIPSGQTLMGIQTATYAHDRWWFGCYGNPKVLLVTDSKFASPNLYEFDCSLGIAGLPGGRLLVASGICMGKSGCDGQVTVARPDKDSGLKKSSSLKR
ncbi:MAG: glycerophosphodiester phosphodiesterase [Pirellulaceae bacterium]